MICHVTSASIFISEILVSFILISLLAPINHLLFNSTLIILTSWNKVVIKIADQTMRREDQTPAESLVV